MHSTVNGSTSQAAIVPASGAGVMMYAKSPIGSSEAKRVVRVPSRRTHSTVATKSNCTAAIASNASSNGSMPTTPLRSAYA